MSLVQDSHLLGKILIFLSCVCPGSLQKAHGKMCVMKHVDELFKILLGFLNVLLHPNQLLLIVSTIGLQHSASACW